MNAGEEASRRRLDAMNDAAAQIMTKIARENAALEETARDARLLEVQAQQEAMRRSMVSSGVGLRARDHGWDPEREDVKARESEMQRWQAEVGEEKEKMRREELDHQMQGLDDTRRKREIVQHQVLDAHAEDRRWADFRRRLESDPVEIERRARLNGMVEYARSYDEGRPMPGNHAAAPPGSSILLNPFARPIIRPVAATPPFSNVFRPVATPTPSDAVVHGEARGLPNAFGPISAPAFPNVSRPTVALGSSPEKILRAGEKRKLSDEQVAYQNNEQESPAKQRPQGRYARRGGAAGFQSRQMLPVQSQAQVESRAEEIVNGLAKDNAIKNEETDIGEAKEIQSKAHVEVTAGGKLKDAEVNDEEPKNEVKIEETLPSRRKYWI